MLYAWSNLNLQMFFVAKPLHKQSPSFSRRVTEQLQLLLLSHCQAPQQSLHPTPHSPFLPTRLPHHLQHQGPLRWSALSVPHWVSTPSSLGLKGLSLYSILSIINKMICKAAHVHHSLCVAVATALVGPNKIFIACNYIEEGKNALWLSGPWNGFHWPERD